MLGMMFGRWAVIKRSQSNASGHAMWLCRCSCGTERNVLGISLRYGSSKSCGCIGRQALRCKKNGMPTIIPGETWKAVPGLVNGERIEASSFGRIRNDTSGHVYKPRLYFGYELVVVGTRFRKVHRLVAAAFIPNPENKKTVNHKNGVKRDNSPDNLEWATQAENMRHAYGMGLIPPLPGSSNGASKLVERDVEQIRRWYPLGLRQVDLAQAFGVSQRAISLIVRKEKWCHV